MWSPYNYPGSVSINTSFNIDTLVESEYRLPSVVMRTAVKPMDVNDSLNFDFEIGDPTLQFYVYLHFAELEILQGNQHREFNVEINGEIWEKSVVPSYLRSTTEPSVQPVRGSKLRFSLYKTSNSTLPPILNAMEIYVMKDFLQEATNQEDGKFLCYFLCSCCRSNISFSDSYLFFQSISQCNPGHQIKL